MLLGTVQYDSACANQDKEDASLVKDMKCYLFQNKELWMPNL